MSSDITIAATLFRNVYGQSAAVKALPALVALSAIGHLLSVAFSVCTYFHHSFLLNNMYLANIAQHV